MAKKIALDLDIKSASAGEAVTRTKSLKQELKELKNELLSGNLTGAEFDKARQRAGQLQDQIGDLNQEVRNLANDTPKLAAITDVATGIAGGFSAAQGAMALFGSENEDLQKALIKTQGAMALLNGVQALSNTLNKSSAFSTIALSKAQGIAAATTRTLSAAFGGLTKAIIATGVGALVVGIGLLIANFDKLVKAMQSATSQARKYAESQQEIAKNSLEKIENFDEEARTLRRLGFEENIIAQRRRDNFIQALKDQEAALKAQEELVKTTENSFKKVETWEKFGFGLIPRLLFGDEKDIENAKKGAEEIRKQIEKLENDRFEFEEKIKKEDAEREKKAEEEKKKIRTDAAKRRMEAQKVDAQRLISTIINDYDRELAALKFKHAEEQRLAKLNGENLAILKRVQDKELFELEQRNAEELKAADTLNIQDRTKQLDDFFARKKAIKEAEAALEQELLSQTSNVIGALSMIAKDNSVTQKALALAQIAFDTGVAISSLVKNSQANPANSVTGGAAGAVQFATGLARILTSVAQAKRVVQSGSTSGAGAGSAAGAGMQAFGNIPTDVGSGLDTRAFTQGQTRVYVVENDITRAQRRVAQIRENAIID